MNSPQWSDEQPQTPASATPIADGGAEPKPAPALAVKKPSRLPLYAGVGVVVVLALAAATFAGLKFLGNKPLESLEAAATAHEPKGPLAPFATGSIAKLQTYETPQDAANIAFVDRNRQTLHLADFKGQVVVLNVWATWCAPCRFEMPTLANLQRAYAGKGLKVIPLSVDTEDKFDDVKSFIDVQEPLEVYADTKFAAPSKFNVVGMPVTIIINKNGQAVARLDGEATWDTKEVKALMDKLLAE